MEPPPEQKTYTHHDIRKYDLHLYPIPFCIEKPCRPIAMLSYEIREMVVSYVNDADRECHEMSRKLRTITPLRTIHLTAS